MDDVAVIPSGYYTDSDVRIGVSDDVIRYVIEHHVNMSPEYLGFIANGYVLPDKCFVYISYDTQVVNHDNSFEQHFYSWIAVNGNHVQDDYTYVSGWRGGSLSGSYSGVLPAGSVITWSCDMSNDHAIHWSNIANTMLVVRMNPV